MTASHMQPRRDQTRLFGQYFLQAKRLPEDARTLLDVGCAYGDALAEIRSAYPDLILTGMDFEPYHVKAARKFHRGIEFLRGDLFRLPERRWDVIYCSNVLEHFYRAEAMRAAQALLAHCSTLYVMCPYMDSTAVEMEGDGTTGRAWEGHRWVLDETSFDGLAGVDIEHAIFDTPGAWHYKQILFTLRARP